MVRCWEKVGKAGGGKECKGGAEGGKIRLRAVDSKEAKSLRKGVNKRVKIL